MGQARASAGGPVWSALVVALLSIGTGFLPGFREHWGQTMLLIAGILLTFLGLVALVRGYALGGLCAIALGIFLLPFLCYAIPGLVRGDEIDPSAFPNPFLNLLMSLGRKGS